MMVLLACAQGCSLASRPLVDLSQASAELSSDQGQAGVAAAVGSQPGIHPVSTGRASWYGPGFRGRKTASGDIFDDSKFTAAHKTLPLGTIAKVTNLSNGRSVKVEINDRGPYVDGRVIDLSQAAAHALGMVDRGITHVRIERIVNEESQRVSSFD
jgi:rare lipoprotein A